MLNNPPNKFKRLRFDFFQRDIIFSSFWILLNTFRQTYLFGKNKPFIYFSNPLNPLIFNGKPQNANPKTGSKGSVLIFFRRDTVFRSFWIFFSKRRRCCSKDPPLWSLWFSMGIPKRETPNGLTRLRLDPFFSKRHCFSVVLNIF